MLLAYVSDGDVLCLEGLRSAAPGMTRTSVEMGYGSLWTILIVWSSCPGGVDGEPDDAGDVESEWKASGVFGVPGEDWE